jgi:exodeoxyribonuclease-3
MIWEEDFKTFLHNLEKTKPVIVCGDFNVAHNEIDIKNAKANIGNAGFTNEERDKFTKLLDSGFIDTFRYYNPDTIKYTWWSFMGNAGSKNIGWRIDYFIVSNSIIDKVKETYIFDNIFGSDHCPIGININD